MALVTTLGLISFPFEATGNAQGCFGLAVNSESIWKISIRTVWGLEEWRLLDVMPWGCCKDRRSEELSSSIIRVTRIGELGTTLAVTLFLVHRFLSPWWWRRWVPPISVLTKATRCNITENAILHSHCRENLKSYCMRLRLMHVVNQTIECCHILRYRTV
jgi:hypothetical protein